MTARTHIFKLFVSSSSELSIKILEYIDDNIVHINRMGVVLKITKLNNRDLDKTLVDKFAAQGILRFPALVTHENKVHLGVRKIKQLFESNLRAFEEHRASQQRRPNDSLHGQQSGGSTPFLQDFADDPSLAQFYSREMSAAAMEKERGDDDGFETGRGDDFNRRISEQMKQRKISPDAVPTNEFNVEDMMARRQVTTGAQRRGPGNSRTTARETNNIADDTPPVRHQPPPTTNIDPAPTDGFDDSIFDRAFMERL